MLSLKQRPQDGKHRYDQNRPRKRQQSGPNGRANAVRRIIGSDIPADVSTGQQQYDHHWFDGALH